MRKLTILAALALLALVAVPIVQAAVSKPLMTVEGNVIVQSSQDSNVTAITRFEIRTTESGKVEFGYYETQSLTGLTGTLAGLHSLATVESVKFSNGGKTAEFTGTECGPAVLGDPTSDWTCNPDYFVQVTDNAGKGVPDTICGGVVGQGCLYPGTVTGGDIRIFSRQQ